VLCAVYAAMCIKLNHAATTVSCIVALTTTTARHTGLRSSSSSDVGFIDETLSVATTAAPDVTSAWELSSRKDRVQRLDLRRIRRFALLQKCTRVYCSDFLCACLYALVCACMCSQKRAFTYLQCVSVRKHVYMRGSAFFMRYACSTPSWTVIDAGG
jgi:hypothetical protein